MAGRGRLGATISASAAFLMAGIPAGCSQPTGQQPLGGSCTPFTVVSSTPPDGADQVPTDVLVSIGFSDFPNPETVGLGSVLLSSGVQTRLGTFQVDLITRSIRFRIRNLLWPNLTYLVTVRPDVQSLQGCPAAADQRTFQTGNGPTDPPPPPPSMPSFTDDVLPLFATRCAGAGCHRQSLADGGGCLTAPAKDLSLCDAEAWTALVGAAATELAGVRRVVPGDASRSFLMRKLIPGAPDGSPLPTTPGHRDPPDAPLDEPELRLISDWIDAGATR